jgi:hypothetical protein
MASLQPDDAVRYLARHGAGRAALLALALAAACGGDRNRPAAGDTAGAATVTPDSAAMPVSDSSMPAAEDSARSAAPTADTTKSMSRTPTTKPPSASATRPAAPTDTGAKHAAPTPATGKQMAAAEARTAHDSAKAPSPQAKRDTARVQKAEATNSAATPAPAPTAQQQDTTSKATATAETPLRDAYHQAPHDTVSQSVYDGWKQFNLNCARCHGEDALGTTIAPHLILSLKPDGPINTKELFMQTVCAGRPAKGMPAWCALGLGMDKISNIYEYVKGRSDAKISPGRPAVKEQG